jgi:hypothetical protein
MAWVNVEVLDKHQLESGAQRINVRFSTDDATPRTFSVPIDIAPGSAVDFFDRTVRRMLTLRTERDAAKAQADAVAAGTYVPGPEPPPPTPDPDQPDINTFMAAVRRLQSYRSAVEMEIIPATDADYVALRTQVQTFVASRPAIKDKLLRML